MCCVLLLRRANDHYVSGNGFMVGIFVLRLCSPKACSQISIARRAIMQLNVKEGESFVGAYQKLHGLPNYQSRAVLWVS